MLNGFGPARQVIFNNSMESKITNKDLRTWNSVEALLLLMVPPSQNPILLNYYTNSVCFLSSKWPAPVTNTFLAFQWSPLMRASTVNIISSPTAVFIHTCISLPFRCWSDSDRWSLFQVPTMAIEKVFIYNNTSIIQDEVSWSLKIISL